MTASPNFTPEIEEFPDEKGYLKLTRGVDGFNWRRLFSRAGVLGFPMMLLIIDRTISFYGSPRSAHIPSEEFEKLTRRTANRIRAELANLERIGMITRDADDPWRFTPHPEAFDKAPILMPEKHPTAILNRQARNAAMVAGGQHAALRSTIGLPADPHLTVTSNPQIPLDLGGEKAKLTVLSNAPAVTSNSSAVTSNRPAETYCPWNWTCPHLSNDLSGDKPFKPLNPKNPDPQAPVAAAPGSEDLYKDNPSSVGRSLTPEATDRPTAGSVTKQEIRSWLESNVPIPGFPLKEPELNAIAATIQTPLHFEQFKEAALKQKNPRGWRVYVSIAQNCQMLHDKYAQAKTATAAAGEREDPLLKRLQQAVEERKPWKTD